MTEAMKLKDTCSLEEKLKPRQHIKKHRHYFADKGPSSQSYRFSISLVWMWELDYFFFFESWIIKKDEHRRIDAFELCVVKDSWASLGKQGDQTSSP